MKRRILIVSLSLMICASYAQIYKWTDSQGVVHFSDSPHPGAQTVDNPEIQSFSSPTPSEPEAKPEEQEEIAPKKKVRTYKSLTLVQPANDETIRNTNGYILVKAQVEPKLFPEDSVQMVFDGSAQGAPQHGLSFQLNGVNRGSHTIAVQIINAFGKVVKTSPAITVYMQQPRINMGNRPSL